VQEDRRVFAPDSPGLLVGLGVLAVVAVVVTAGRRVLPLRTVAAVVALVAVFTAGAAAVNVWFGYFSTWADVSAGLDTGVGSGDHLGRLGLSASPTAVPAAVAGRRPLRVLSLAQLPAVLGARPAGGAVSSTGTLVAVSLVGRRSHITRPGLVWLPPQYREPAYASTRFPVVELIPGTPGQPQDWIAHLHVDRVLAALTAAGRIGPMVVVLAPSNPPLLFPRRRTGHGQECTNKGVRGAQDSTFMGVDVPADIAGALRVYPPGPRWAVGGYSSGGYCAADLTLKHPGTYGAVADLDGYLSPLEDGNLWHVIFNKDWTAIRAYDVRAELALDRRRLPPFYLAAGVGNVEDLRDLRVLQSLLRARTAVTTVLTPGGHHYPVWAAELPTTLTWIWDHIGRPARTPSPRLPPVPRSTAPRSTAHRPATHRPAPNTTAAHRPGLRQPAAAGALGHRPARGTQR